MDSNQAVSHLSVLVREVLDGLLVHPAGRYLDATLGSGGHAEAILEAGSPDARLLGLDVDPKAIERSRIRLSRFEPRVTLVQSNFASLADQAKATGFLPLDGIIADLGFSSPQMADPDFGLSFQRDDVLDMRLDPTLPATAADLLNELDEVEIARILFEYGEERASRRIARKIVQARPIRTTRQLTAIVESTLGRGGGKIHPATRTFQALRIAVNDELGVLERTLLPAINSLRPGGRLAVISFHSLEDRIVKRRFQDEARDCICPPGLPACQCGHKAIIRLITKHPITASAAETTANPRARSAKLRIAERTVEAA